MIDILVPVLDRPLRARAVAESACLAAAVPYVLTFVLTPGDERERDAVLQVREEVPGVQLLLAPFECGPGDYARKINYAFQHTQEAWVFTGADDLDFHPGWDLDAVQVGESRVCSVVGTNDMGNPTVMRGNHSTHSLVRRAYVDSVGATFDMEPGVVLYDGYDHQYVDTELIAAAKAHGLYQHALTSCVEHMHPFWHKGTTDATYSKALAEGGPDGRLFRQRERAHRTMVRQALRAR